MKVYSPLSGLKLISLSPTIHFAMAIAFMFILDPFGLRKTKQENYEIQVQLGYVRLGYAFLIGHITVGTLQVLGRTCNHGGKCLDFYLVSEALGAIMFLMLDTICLQQYIYGDITCLEQRSVAKCYNTRFIFRQWIQIEFLVVRMNVLAALIFIAYKMLKSRYKQGEADLLKQKVDFMTYIEPEFTWYAKHFILISLPLWNLADLLRYYGFGTHFSKNMVNVIMCLSSGLIHAIFFCVKGTIYDYKPREGSGHTRDRKLSAYRKSTNLTVQDEMLLAEAEEEQEQELEGLEAKYSVYTVYLREFNSNRWWSILPPMVCDIAFFVYQFWNQEGDLILNATLIVQCFMSISQLILYLLMKYRGPHEELNREVMAIDIPKEQEKLAADGKFLKLPSCIYGLFFRTFHIKSYEQMGMDKRDAGEAVEGTFIAVAIQWGMIFLVSTFISQSVPAIDVCMPRNAHPFVARLLAIFMMHLQFEPQTREGLQMMKYAMNHPGQLSNRVSPFVVGCILWVMTIALEVISVFYISTLHSTLSIITSQVTLACIARVPIFYAGALQDNIKFKATGIKPLIVSAYRANKENIEYREDQADRSKCCTFMIRAVYNVCRFIYTVAIYYFIMFLVLWVQIFDPNQTLCPV